MIIDTIENANRYYGVHPRFQRAFDYIRYELPTAADGKGDIAEGLKSIISTAPGKTAEASLAKFECHDRNIDIQYCISGVETIGWRPRTACSQPNGGFNAEKDVQFFHDAPHPFFQLQPGQFAIFFPEDVHAPMIGEGEIRKLVVKVAI
jgi:YhcH/YjgK/YiaL family protein